MRIQTVLRGALVLAAALTLTACVAAIQEEVGECEPGVEDLSQIATAVPLPNC